MTDLSHEESLIYPEKGGNSINWILGHIIVTRDFLLELTGNKAVCDPKISAGYNKNAGKINSDNAEDLFALVDKYKESQDILLNTFNEKDFRSDTEINENIAGLCFHEAYHLGQIGILRRIIGKKGMIG